MEEQYEFFATCPKGFERLLADEIKRLKAHRVRPLKGGVAFFWWESGRLSGVFMVSNCFTRHSCSCAC